MVEITPQAFAERWSKSTLSEKSASQQHFLDLCRLLNQPTPAGVDPEDSFYTFEKDVEKTSGGKGFADVWYKGRFAWEYKGKHKDLIAAYNQLLLYKDDLENPPLLVVSDMERYEVHTNFTGTVKKVYRFTNDELPEPENLKVLRALFEDQDSLRPARTSEGVTEDAARRFAQLADGLRERGIEPQRAAHFLNKLLFCLFAEDIGLLPSLHGRGAERLDRRATAVRATDAYPGKLLQAGGSRADAGNGTLEPVAVSIGPQYGTVGPFRPPGATGTRWSALLAWERGTAPCVAGPKGTHHA